MVFPEDLFTGIPSGPLHFFLSTAVALAAAAPIGPISILTIQRAISLGFWRAFWPTLGAVTANGIYGFIAALGTGYLSTSIIGSEIWLRLIGSVILTAMGVRLYTHRHMDREMPEEGFEPLHLAFLNFTLVLSNPLTLAFYLAAFTLLGLKSESPFGRQSFFMGAGIVFGALTWFAFICLTASKFHLKVSDALLKRIRMGIGILFVLLGIVSAASLLLRG